MTGRDPDDLAGTCRARAPARSPRNHGAKAAVDVALHDLAARRRGVSLPVLLGGTALRVPTDVTLAAGGRRRARGDRPRPGRATASGCSR